MQPAWLLLLALVPWAVWVSRRSLAGLGPVRRPLAIGLRCLLLTLLVLALAELRWRVGGEGVTVLYVVDRSASVPEELPPGVPADRAEDRRWQRVRRLIEESVARQGTPGGENQSGMIVFGRRPRLALPPAPVSSLPADPRLAGPINPNATDIAAAIKLALASFPEGTGRRIVLISDGNETIGRAEAQAALAKQAGATIDCVALAPDLRHDGEVLVQAVEAAPLAEGAARPPVRVLIRNAHPARLVEGRLTLVRVTSAGDVPLSVEDGAGVLEPAPPALVRLEPGLNRFRFRDKADGGESVTYRANFAPTRSFLPGGAELRDGLPGDRPANNQASATAVARGQRRALFVDAGPDRDRSPHAHLIRTLEQSKIRVDYLPVDRLPADPAELTVFLSNFDAMVLADVPYDRLGPPAAEAIRAAVRDQGCGLVAVGGPDSFGPGGYQGSPLEAALPVDCDIKAVKAAGKGGLVLVMHASEMADGNKWQKEIAKLAVRRLGPTDMVGVAQYGFGGDGVDWQVPFQEIGDGRGRILDRLDRMTPGDMISFDPFLAAAADALTDPKHGLAVRHCILISDGDPSYTTPGAGNDAVGRMVAAGVTCTTVGVAAHGEGEKSNLKRIAMATRDAQGKPGNFYDVTNPAQLPAIYIKESRRVSQSFVYDKRFEPQLRRRTGPTDGLPGELPPLYGFVRTTLKANPLVELLIEGPPAFDQKFPVLAGWRYGLGKAAAFTSDARTQPGIDRRYWDREWAGSEVYRKFWEQLVTWALRDAERGRLQLTAEYRDGAIRVQADARDDRNRPASGLKLTGRVTAPAAGAAVPTLEFRPKGGGLYEAEFPADDPGGYFVTVQASRAGDAEPFDTARAAAAVPYSQEFADLESNAPLMMRIAEVAGGRYHPEPRTDAEVESFVTDADFYRPAPGAPRAARLLWPALLFLAGLVLLADVAVRRVAPDPARLKAAAARFWAKLRRGRTPVEAAALDRLARRKQAVGEELERTARRYEPTADAGEQPAAGFRAGEVAAPLPPAPPPAAPAPASEEDPLERLRKARDRTRRPRDRE